MSLPVRPGVKETDEDLVRLQQSFISENPELCVKVAKHPAYRRNETKHTDSSDSHSLPSRKTECHSIKSLPESGSTPLSLPSWISPPVTDIKESSENERSVTDQPPRKKSLFALRAEKSRSDLKRHAEHSSFESTTAPTSNKFGNRSHVISGNDSEEIHQQNTELLSKMSLQEIHETRQQLISQLSSSSLKFLKSLRNSPQLSANSSVTEKLVKADMIETEDTAIENAGPPPKKPLSVDLNLTSESNTSTDNHLYETLPINPNEAKQWLHMTVVEKEKLEWMKALPPVKSAPSSDNPYPARFNFDGLLLPYNDESIEVNKGLHHHGEEPERPGYTLQELMQLCRSSVQQQRVVGLTALGNIFLQSKLGIYDEVLQQNILKELLDAGIFLLIRFSMDDSSPPVVFAALTAMRNLLFNEADEASLDFCLGCEGGLFHPLLDVPCEETNPKKIKEQKEYETELKDFEIMQLDILKGALRTNLIVRLGYILDVLKGPPGAVLDILTRIARHSRELAEAVVGCGGLLKTIRDELLTCHVVSALAASSGYTGYGEPSAKALRLFRVLASHSRTIANTLVDKFNIMEPVMTFVSMSSPELPHFQSLVIGGYYLWQTLMTYGLASQAIVDLFPILMRQLHFHVQLTSAVGDNASSSGHELATAIAGIIEKAAEILYAGHTSLEAVPVFQLSKLLVDCTQKWLAQLSSSSNQPAWSCVKMMGGVLNSLAAVAKYTNIQKAGDSHSMLLKLESLTYEKVLPFLKSSCLEYLLSKLKPCSFLLSNSQSGKKRDPSNLPSLGALEWGGEGPVPGLQDESPHPFLSGLLRFLIATHELFGSSTKQFEGVLLDNHSLVKYVMALVTQPLRSSENWFSRQEIYMLCHLLSLVVLKPSTVPELLRIRYCQLAFCLVDLIQINDKHLINSLFPLTIFNVQFVRWGLSHTEPQDVLSDVMEECILNLPTIHSIYGDILGTKYLRQPSPSQRLTLTSQSRGNEPALPVDWHHAPLLHLYGQHNARDRSRGSERDAVVMVKSSLQLLLMVETLWPNACRPLSVTAKWCRLSLVFLAGSDFFLDPDVKRLLQINTKILLEKRSELNFLEKIPGLSSFNDLYGELLLQFSAVSYGDRLFGAFLLIPLQQNQDPQLRRMIWGEFAVVLRCLSTPIEEVGIPLENYLNPCESDPNLLTCYVEALAKGNINKIQCPVLYHVALHHVATFVKLHWNEPFAHSLQKHIARIGNEELKNLLLNYDATSGSASVNL